MDENFDELQALWSSQDVERIEMNVIRHLSEDFSLSVRRRNWLEWAACALVLFFFGQTALTSESWLIKLGALEICAATLYIAWRLWNQGRVQRTSDPTLSTQEHLGHHRKSLLAQAALLRRAPMWYVAPIFVGWSLIWLGTLLELIRDQEPLVAWIFYLFAGTGIFAAVAWWNLRGAARLKQRADELL